MPTRTPCRCSRRPASAATDGRGVAGAAVAFERLAGALAEERVRLAEKVDELERANAALLEARESLVRAERLATAGQLASGIAHEVGNPLGAISGYAELARARLRDGSPAALAQAEEFAGRIAAETARIDRIVRDLLDLARPSAPRGAAGGAPRAAGRGAAARRARSRASAPSR